MDSQGASVTDIDGNRYFDQDPDQLFYQLTGMRLPIANMPDWIKGQPTQADHFSISNTGTLLSLSQSRGETWTMNYLNYIDEQTLILPNKMTLSRQQIKLNIVINRWNLK
jgi:outer membrane lipoprotein LolB